MFSKWLNGYFKKYGENHNLFQSATSQCFIKSSKCFRYSQEIINKLFLLYNKVAKKILGVVVVQDKNHYKTCKKAQIYYST